MFQYTIFVTLTSIIYNDATLYESVDPLCGLNGDFNTSTNTCICDAGWKGTNCTLLDLLPVPMNNPGYWNQSLPTWSGNIIHHDNSYHFFLTAKANVTSSDDYYICNSKIVRLTSINNNSLNGPFELKTTVLPRYHQCPFIYSIPNANGKNETLYLLYTTGYENIPNLTECANATTNTINYNRSHNTIHLSYTYGDGVLSGDGMNSQWNTSIIYDPFPGTINRSQWDCYVQNPTAYIYPNLTVILIYRGTECETYYGPNTSREHIGIAIAKHWKGPYIRYSKEPVFGWDIHSEDPFIWRNKRGFHLLMHGRNNKNGTDKRVEGAYAYSINGLDWIYQKGNINTSPWPNYIEWENGTKTIFSRRQKPSLIFDENNNPKYIINGVDIGSEGDGQIWATAWTLIQEINQLS
eukprot:202811_1